MTYVTSSAASGARPSLTMTTNANDALVAVVTMYSASGDPGMPGWERAGLPVLANGSQLAVGSSGRYSSSQSYVTTVWVKTDCPAGQVVVEPSGTSIAYVSLLVAQYRGDGTRLRWNMWSDLMWGDNPKTDADGHYWNQTPFANSAPLWRGELQTAAVGDMVHVLVANRASAPAVPSPITLRQSRSMQQTVALIADRHISPAAAPMDISGAESFQGAGVVNSIWLHGPVAPRAPIWITPDRDFEHSKPATLVWSATRDQVAYCLRDTAHKRWWDGSAWVDTETWVDSTAQQVTLPAQPQGTFITAELRVRTAAGVASPPSFATPLFQWVSRPVATIVVSPQTGGVVTSLLPRIVVKGGASSDIYTATITIRQDGMAERVLTVRPVYSAADGGGVYQVTVADAVANLSTIEVVGAFTHNLLAAAPASSGVLPVNVPGAPAAPKISASADLHPTSGLPCVRVVVTVDHPLPAAVHIQRSLDGGPWLDLGDDGGRYPVTSRPQTVSLADYTAPVKARWRARVIDLDTPETAGPWAVTAFTPPAGWLSGWLRDPQTPETAMRLETVCVGTRTIEERAKAVPVLEAGRWWVHRQPQMAAQSSITWAVYTQAEEAALLELTAMSRPLLWTGCLEHNARDNRTETPRTIRLRVIDGTKVDVETQEVPDSARLVCVSYVEV